MPLPIRRILAAGVVGAILVSHACRQTPADVPGDAEIQQVADRLYVITGGGGNTAAFITDSGVVLVDTKSQGWGPATLRALRTVTDRPIAIIINTHWHGDHVAGNVFLGGAAKIVAHENTKTHMTQIPEFQGAGATFLPSQTFTSTLSLLEGRDRIDLYYFGAGHTDGDAIVVFPALRTAHTGDLFSGKTPPIIERFNGGSGLRYPQTLRNAVASLPDVEFIITGHGPTVLTREDLQNYADFTSDVLAWAQREWKAGRSASDAAKRYQMPEKYRDYVDQWRVTGDINIIYRELNGKRPWTFLWHTEW